MNLVVNAREAMPYGGRIRIATRLVRSAGDRDGEGDGGDLILIEIRDTGGGIPPDDLEHIFEPFFTTKPQGTGLGLSVVHGIIGRAGGRIEVASRADEGTTFAIYLPRADAAAWPPDSAPLPAADEVTAHGCVLLVEDDARVLDPVRRALEKTGYRVLAANGPDEAHAIVEEHGASIDVVVTDVVMPRTSGAELARWIRERAPGAKTLFVSGYPRGAGSEDLARALSASGTAFLAKPFSPEELVRAIRDVLESRRGDSAPSAGECYADPSSQGALT